MSTTLFKAGILFDLKKAKQLTLEELSAELALITGRKVEIEEEHLFFKEYMGPFQIVNPYKSQSDWRLAIWLSQEKDYGSYFVMNLEQINKMFDWINKNFKTLEPTNISIAAYEYYNGVDDPLNINELSLDKGRYGISIPELMSIHND